MSKRGIFILVVIVSLLVMACSCNIGTYFNNILKAVEETMNDEVSEIAEEVILDIVPLDEEVEPEELDVQLARPIMVIHTLNQILVINEYGIEMKEVYSGAYIQQVAASPMNKMVAFLTSELEYGDGQLNLYILDLKTNQMKLITPLTNDQTTLYNADQGVDVDYEARDANIAISWSSLVWSPTGEYLAFLGAQEGKFAHVYTYHPASGEVTQLLGGDSHHFSPVWSPDGKFVVAPSAFGFGTGAGYLMDAVWAARPDGGEGYLLCDATNSSDETIHGWFDNSTMVVSSVDMLAGNKHLRAIDILTGDVKVDILSPSDYFSSAAIAEGYGTVLFDFPFSDLGEFIEGETILVDGLYHWRPDGSGVSQLSDTVDYWSTVVWNAQTECFYAKLPALGTDVNFIQAYTPNGEINETQCAPIVQTAEDMPLFAPSGDKYVWAVRDWSDPSNNAVYFARTGDSQGQKLADGTAGQMLWHPDEDKFYFIIGNQIFKAEGADMQPSLVTDVGEEFKMMLWAMP